MEFFGTHPLWIKSLKFHSPKEKKIAQMKSDNTRQCSIDGITEVPYTNKVRKKFEG